MDQQSDKMTALPPQTTCTFKRSFVKVSKEFNSGSIPSITLTSDRRNSIDFNRRVVELKGRSESPLSFFRLKFCDSSSGYGSTNSLSSSAFSSIQRTSSMHCLSQPSQQPITKETEKPNRAQMVRDSITNILDQIDKRVAFLRETASELEEEKRKLLRVLNSIITCEELSAIEDVEKEEIKVTTHGLLYRLNSVDVVLTTPRTQSQEKALENVEQFLEKLLEIAKTDRKLAIHSCQSYLSACTSDHFRSVPVDEKFLKLIVECAVDDQKKIKKKLENLFSSLTKLENS